MKSSKHWILGGVLLASIGVTGLFLFMATLSPVRLELVDHYPAKRIQFVNDTGRGLNFFFFSEVKSKGIWVSASPQPKDARFMNYVKPHSLRELEIAPEPGAGTAWSAGFGLPARASASVFDWANRLGWLKDYRDR